MQTSVFSPQQLATIMKLAMMTVTRTVLCTCAEMLTRDMLTRGMRTRHALTRHDDDMHVMLHHQDMPGQRKFSQHMPSQPWRN